MVFYSPATLTLGDMILIPGVSGVRRVGPSDITEVQLHHVCLRSAIVEHVPVVVLLVAVCSRVLAGHLLPQVLIPATLSGVVGLHTGDRRSCPWWWCGTQNTPAGKTAGCIARGRTARTSLGPDILKI